MTAVEDQPDALADEDEDEDDEDDQVVPPVAGGDSEASLEEILAKREASSEEADEAEEESLLTAEPDERVGVLPAKVAPQQETEFVCKNCFLVKHRSQLADKRRMLCKDCA